MLNTATILGCLIDFPTYRKKRESRAKAIVNQCLQMTEMGFKLAKLPTVSHSYTIRITYTHWKFLVGKFLSSGGRGKLALPTMLPTVSSLLEIKGLNNRL